MSLINDYKAHVKHSKSRLKPLFKIHLFVMLLFRISNFFYKLKLTPVSRIFWLINRVFFSIDIDPGATLKGGVVILHGIGIVIGRYVIAEGDFKIYQGATLGGNNGKVKTYGDQLISQPYLVGNNVIGINATILGPVVLGQGVVAGANAVVTKDVLDNMVVISNNKIIKNDD